MVSFCAYPSHNFHKCFAQIHCTDSNGPQLFFPYIVGKLFPTWLAYPTRLCILRSISPHQLMSELVIHYFHLPLIIKYQLCLTPVKFDIHMLMQIKLEQVQRQVTKWILKTSNEYVLKLQTSIKNIPYQSFLQSRHHDHESH